MTNLPLGVWLVAMVGSAAIPAVWFGGCTLERQGLLDQQCSSPEACDDANPCTEDVCDPEGQCEHRAVDGPSANQIAHDCRLNVCSGGELTALYDPSDIYDDGNSCTEDGCSENGPVSSLLPEGTPCDDGNGHTGTCGLGVDLPGECLVQCTPANAAQVCDDANDCTVDACDTSSSHCTRQHLDGVPAPGAAQIPGDCQLIVCVNGQQQMAADNADVPDDGNECTEDLCDGGVPVPDHPSEPLDTPCTQGGGAYCDGQGHCAECNASSQCGDPSCLCITCQDHVCTYVAQGVPAAQPCQPGTPCHEQICDGAGNHNDHALADDAACNDGAYCNGTDRCSAGSCSVHAGNPCQALVGDGDGNCAEACNEGSDNCSANDANGSACSDGLYCNGSDTCNNGACSTHAGNPCPGPNGNGDCSESCNETSDNCSANDPNGTACDDGLYCTGTDTCNNGACSSHTGNACPGADGDGDCSESCNESTNDCTANDPNGTACPGNKTCQNGVCT